MIPAKAASADPTITILPPAGPAGIPITVNGTNFQPGATVDLSWFGFIIDIPGIGGHLGNYPLKTGITVASDGSFQTTIISPNDFSDITHFVNATQNGAGTGITNATFTIAPSLRLSPQPANYTEGQDVILSISGTPLGTAALMMNLTQRVTVLKFTYDNMAWGFATSHLETEGPIVTGGLTGGDIGGNATIRFKAVGGIGKHAIRGYVGEKDSPVYLPCEIGGEGEFFILGPNLDTQSILDNLASLNATILGVQGDTVVIKTNSGTITGTITNIKDGVATIQTSIGDLNLTVDAVKGSENGLAMYSTGALALSIISLVILLAVAIQVSRKPKQLS